MVPAEELRRLLRQRPFRPFRVHVQDGRTFDVRYPEINMVFGSTLIIGIPVPNDPDPVYESKVMLPLAWITAVEMLPEPATPAAS